ncbi:uncharacterized protein [Nicotiana tomentosiformis]|uniref:uncharacterized protein isoform X1 n=1 Tax=Nicotiana tomentosiformis TaxID=4098 RepID=UPI00388C7A90
MDLYSSAIIHYHLNVIQDLLMVMMDNNARMLRHLDNIENMLPASSKTTPTLHSTQTWLCLCTISTKQRNSQHLLLLQKQRLILIWIKDSPTLCTIPRRTIQEVVPDREIDMEVANSMRNNSVNPETQVSNEMFQPFSAVKYAYSHLIIFDDQLALPCMLIASSHGQPIGRDIIDYLSELYRAKSLCRFPPDHFGLHFPFDPGSRYLTTYFGSTRKYISGDALGNLTSDMLMVSTLWNRLMRRRGTLLTQSLVFFIKSAATVLAYIFQAIFHGSVGVGIDKLVKQLSAMEVHLCQPTVFAMRYILSLLFGAVLRRLTLRRMRG